MHASMTNQQSASFSSRMVPTEMLSKTRTLKMGNMSREIPRRLETTPANWKQDICPFCCIVVHTIPLLNVSDSFWRLEQTHQKPRRTSLVRSSWHSTIQYAAPDISISRQLTERLGPAEVYQPLRARLHQHGGTRQWGRYPTAPLYSPLHLQSSSAQVSS